jgi:hypothetical protein
MNGGERGLVVGRLWYIVEAHHADVARHIASQLSQSSQHSQGHLIVCGEYRGGFGDGSELESGCVSCFGAPIATDDGWHAPASGLECLSPCAFSHTCGMRIVWA